MNSLRYTGNIQQLPVWHGESGQVITDSSEVLAALKDLGKAWYLVETGGMVGITSRIPHANNGAASSSPQQLAVLAPILPGQLGSREFQNWHGLDSSYMAGAMANGIAGEQLVIGLGRKGYLGSFGAGGLSPARIKSAINTVQEALPDGPYAFNLIHSPAEPALEQAAVDLYLAGGVETIEASAYLRLTPMVVQYRAAGLSRTPDGEIIIANKVIAKLSRREVAMHFLSPAPEKILTGLVNAGKITPHQAELAEKIPLADDVTVEADSGGHTDNRPLLGLLPSIRALQQEIQAQYRFPREVRIGAAGGIGTPEAALAAFSLGAAYIVTGSVNQSCLEADTSQEVKTALAQAAATDVMMAPSADMFEMGVNVQVLKRGTMFPMRSRKLYQVYQDYEGIEDLPPDLREELETRIFQQDLDQIWRECETFFTERDPEQLEKARQNPKRKMGLIFRWYLGLATHWGIQGLEERKLDYQVWCGPAMGAFNDWVRGTRLEDLQNRRAAEVADQIMLGAAYRWRLNELARQGFQVPGSWERYLD